MAELLGWDVATQKLAPVPGVTVEGDVPLVAAYDTGTGEPLQVPFAEAGRGVLAYARTLGPGSAARGEVERQAIAMLEQAGQWPPSRRKRGRRG